MDNSRSEKETVKLKLSDLKNIHKTASEIVSDIQPEAPIQERKKFIRKIWDKLIPKEKIHKQELHNAINEGEIDRMTQVLNERGFTRRWVEEVSRLRRAKINGEDTQSVLLYLDANKLKFVNDERGHEAGNEYLRSLVLALNESLRPTDIVGRIGGDEFAVILQNTNLLNTRELFETRIKPQLLSKGISVSIGAELIDPDNPDESKIHADKAMYDAKRLSKATYDTIQYKEFGENIR